MLDTFTDEKMDVTLCATIDLLITVADVMDLEFLDVINHLIERKQQFNEEAK